MKSKLKNNQNFKGRKDGADGGSGDGDEAGLSGTDTEGNRR